MALSNKGLAAVTTMLMFVANSFATTATFTGTKSSGQLYGGQTVNDLAAKALFKTSGSQLTVTLKNISTYDVLAPNQVLTGVFFEMPGTIGGVPLVLTPVSATLASGSVVWFGPDGGGDVGGEWAYKSGLTGPITPQAGSTIMGISSTGLSVFGPGDCFHPNDPLYSNTPPDGLGYGLTSAGDNKTTGNTPVTGGTTSNKVPLIKSSVVFTFSGLSALPRPLDPLNDVMNVWFQYGTSFSEPHIEVPDNGDQPPVVPEPITLAGLLCGCTGLGTYLRRRNQQ